MANLSIIVAASSNNVIGIKNGLPWHLPADLKYFKKITDGKTVIMGKKCWESIPEKLRPLPNRNNIVVTTNFDYKANGALIVHDAEMLLSSIHMQPIEEVFVIGGGKLYKMAFNYADRIYMTRINQNIEGDTYLDGFDETKWKIVSKSEILEENGLKFNFIVYEKTNIIFAYNKKF